MLDNLLLIAAAARLGLSFYLSFKKDGYDESLICLLWRISRRRGRPGKTTGLALEIPRSAHILVLALIARVCHETFWLF